MTLSAEDSEKIWDNRKRPAQRTVTATMTSHEKTPTLACTVETGTEIRGAGDFGDLLKIDDDFLDLTRTEGMIPHVLKEAPKIATALL